MQKCANLVDSELKCCQAHIYLQNLASIQPRTSPPKASASQPASGRLGQGGRPAATARPSVSGPPRLPERRRWRPDLLRRICRSRATFYQNRGFSKTSFAKMFGLERCRNVQIFYSPVWNCRVFTLIRSE